MSSFLRSLGSFLSGSESTIPTIEELSKPKPKEAEHGEVSIDQIPPNELLVNEEGCEGCSGEECEHQQYPSYLDFDTQSPLLGSMVPYGRHFMISTAQCDWPAHIEEDYGTLAANLQALLVSNPMPWRTFVTNTSLVPKYSSVIRCGLDVIILPDNIIVGDVTPDDAQLLYDVFVKMPLPTSNEPIHIEAAFRNYNLGNLTIYPNPYDSMILICSHRKRDKRCGVTAPILNREFDHVLRELDIPDGEGGCGVFMVSHVGGHKFAGNVICYINKGRTGIWYGRVKTCHCREIIEETIINKKVIKELYRGSMSHSFGEPTLSKCNRIKW
ncbi:Sucrase/ferredoxin-like-domain-containing protein [Cokeromyces recurvatus]|uniref:Sucrase/ferredoxin-like-domain-containing protein n=1 Tax=Cokeromyces recurvatus TaxID=90255 RepID=UPI002220C983|nr:Sucrase/ferredoxin-like-domain-containing protein [Cokeromyces recurvatus]KAI7906497.1 Sucrase/ferredoxin-like-domain-containing protein [Cokeromyces recurvatus]